MALAQHFAREPFESAEYKLTVFVNDTQAAELAITPSAQTQTLDIPNELLTFAGGKSKQTIRFQLTGRGQYTYQIALGGFVPADKLKSTTADWEVRRYYQPAPLELDGETIPRGFGVVDGSYSSFRNPLTQLPVGVRGQVELHVWRQNVPSRTPDSSLAVPCHHRADSERDDGRSRIRSKARSSVTRSAPVRSRSTSAARRGIGTIRYDLHGYRARHLPRGPDGRPRRLRPRPAGRRAGEVADRPATRVEERRRVPPDAGRTVPSWQAAL